GGGSLAGIVTFPQLTPGLADFFFRNAMAVDLGLAGGFTGRENSLVFINLRDAGGQPLSRLGDDKFTAALQRAAKAFGDIAKVTTARVEAHLMERAAFGQALGAAPVPALDRLRARRAAILAAPR